MFVNSFVNNYRNIRKIFSDGCCWHRYSACNVAVCKSLLLMANDGQVEREEEGPSLKFKSSSKVKRASLESKTREFKKMRQKGMTSDRGLVH
jgi:hypothetical protein